MHYDKFKSITEKTVKWDLTGKSGKIYCYQGIMAQKKKLSYTVIGKKIGNYCEANFS